MFLDNINNAVKDLMKSGGKDDVYHREPMVVSVAMTNQEVKLSGAFLYVESIPAGVTLTVRFNSINNDAVPLLAGQAVRTPFYRVFITTVGVSATPAQIIWGSAFEFVDTGDVTVVGAGLATEATSAAILAKIIAAPATEASLAAMNAKFAALGQALMAASTPVVIASNQSAVPISATALPLPAGAALEAGGHLEILVDHLEGESMNIGGTVRAVSRVAFDVNAATTTVIAAVAAQKIYVVGMEFSVDTDGTTFKLTENTVGDLHAAQTFMRGGGKVVGDRKTVLYRTTTANKALDITTAVGKATGSLWYCQF